MSSSREHLLTNHDGIHSYRSQEEPSSTSDAARPILQGRRFGLVKEYEQNYEMVPHTFNIILPDRNRSSSDTLFSNNTRKMSLDCGELNSVLSSQTNRSNVDLSAWPSFWGKNRGIIFVVVAMFFGAIMSVTTRLLELKSHSREGMQPMQLLFSRMILTSVFSTIYLRYINIPDYALGAKGIRLALVVRGLSGTLGVYGLYYSLQYLPLAEATVITFLAPLVGAWLSSYTLGEPFIVQELLAGLVSLIGVVLIAHPSSLFSPPEESAPFVIAVCADEHGLLQPLNGTCFPVTASPGGPDATSAQRLSAVLVALIGVIGAAVAYCSIRWIGKRAHPLITVNYLAVISTVVCGVFLVLISETGFQLPADVRQWIYLVSASICGFISQFLLTVGLQYEQSNRVANMFYTQLLFALVFDKIIWDVSPAILSIVGSLLVLTSTVYVALRPKSADLKTSDNDESIA